ncbi:MAG: hypothetical protein ACKPJD_31455 [Planctomycetaceae bacterium]
MAGAGAITVWSSRLADVSGSSHREPWGMLVRSEAVGGNIPVNRLDADGVPEKQQKRMVGCKLFLLLALIGCAASLRWIIAVSLMLSGSNTGGFSATLRGANSTGAAIRRWVI